MNKARGRAGAVTILSPAFTYRKYVVRPMPSFLQISETVRSGFAAIVLSISTSFGVKAFGLPPDLPLLLADARPALVRSRIISLSNSAKAPKI